MALLLLTLILGAAGGCEQAAVARAEVHGRVTLDGQPLARGSIVFVPAGEAAGPKAGGQIVGGRYALAAAEGPVVGRLQVQIRAEQSSTAYPIADVRAYQAHGEEAPLPEIVPEQYNEHSVLFVDAVAEQSNELNFDLQTSSDDDVSP
ncbi:MAG: hypothetical protein K1X74_13520 [Pirellulales bacterium]|nr:hypothetical protein [Pirellulales bacterium]